MNLKERNYLCSQSSSLKRSLIATRMISLLFAYRFFRTNSSSPSKNPSGTCTVNNLIINIHTSANYSRMIPALYLASYHDIAVDILLLFYYLKKGNSALIPQYYPKLYLSYIFEKMTLK